MQLFLVLPHNHPGATRLDDALLLRINAYWFAVTCFDFLVDIP